MYNLRTYYANSINKYFNGSIDDNNVVYNAIENVLDRNECISIHFDNIDESDKYFGIDIEYLDGYELCKLSASFSNNAYNKEVISKLINKAIA
jgi:hypothetical protein